jgi:hypothetical protein
LLPASSIWFSSGQQPTKTSEIRGDEDKVSKIWGTDGEGEDRDREIGYDEEIRMTQTGNDEAAKVGNAGDRRSIQIPTEEIIGYPVADPKRWGSQIKQSFFTRMPPIVHVFRETGRMNHILSVANEI